jgi:mRNA interferase RelE/StbE
MPGARYEFAYTDQSLAYLRTLTKKLRRQIVFKIEALAENPRPRGCKKLRGVGPGDEDVFRVRSGDYRVLYVVRGMTIVILDIDHRKDVYR